MIIQDIDTIGTFAIEFLHRSRQHWCVRKQTKIRSYINRSSVHWKIGGRQSQGASFWGGTNNAEGHKGRKSCCTRRITIQEVQLKVQQATKVQTMAKAQWRLMEMEQCEAKAVMKRRHTILEKASLLDKGIKILDP